MQTDGPLLIPEDNDLKKLVEMGKILYPSIQKGYNKDKIFFSRIEPQNVYVVEDDGQHIIPWYEFLIRWIIPKIDIPFSSQWRAFVIDSKDPITPVYERFKREKL
jgi:hypothetical protein